MSEIIEHVEPTPIAVMAAVHLDGVSDEEFAESLGELQRLARTLGYQVAGHVTQRRPAPDRAAYLGPGKLGELTALVNSSGASFVLTDHEITPSQARNLEKATSSSVLDRTAVILEIFHRHARSRQAKAQVEMVRLVYMAPRLREAAHQNRADRARGGAKGGKGAGESALELDRRKIRDRIAELRKEIAQIDEERTTQRARRATLPRVALVGYTNAGKSTLMRALTGSEVYVADKLFATLDTTVRALEPPTHPRILVSDTVGFIRNLPHDLVASFKSTLDEALEASLLLHLVDASDPARERQLAATESVLAEIGAASVPRRVVWNKSDRVADRPALAALAAKHPDSLVISAKDDGDVQRLRQTLIDFFARDSVEAELLVPYPKMSLRATLYDRCEILSETAAGDGVTFKLRTRPEELDRLRALLA
jgi:GTP-binding protein HflX